jgi:ubiquinone/menaquinone biosynthesis C-methylase UbiE
LPFSDHIFDVVYSSYMLDIFSLQDLATALTGFRRVLKLRGRVVLVNLSKEHPQQRTWVEMLYRLLPASWVPYLLGGCRPMLLQDLVREAGFREAERTFIGGMMSSEIVTARAFSE